MEKIRSIDPASPAAEVSVIRQRFSPGGVLRIGLIGCGRAGLLHAERLKADPRVRLTVLSDPDASSMARLQREFAPHAACEADAGRALAEHALDAVVISSPTKAHYVQVRQALALGCHVLCEKPLASRREHVVDLIERQQQSGLVLAVSYQRRTKAAYRTARRELTERSDRYGPLREVHMFVCERWQQTIHGTWRDDPELVSGYFGDAGSHQIDILAFITGLRPRRVWAQSERRGSHVEIVTRAAAELSSGAGLSAHFVGDANLWREEIYFICRDADLVLSSESLHRGQHNRLEPILDLEPLSSPDENFMACILDGAMADSPAQDALPMHDWTNAVLRSIQTGEWVNLNS